MMRAGRETGPCERDWALREHSVASAAETVSGTLDFAVVAAVVAVVEDEEAVGESRAQSWVVWVADRIAMMAMRFQMERWKCFGKQPKGRDMRRREKTGR